MHEMLRERHRVPANLEIVEGGDPFELIIRSDVVSGFNTTALLEALAAGKPVVVPRFGEAFNEQMQPYIVHLEDAVEYADSPDELVKRLRKHALNPTPVERKLSTTTARVLEKWVGNPDGLAGRRVCDAVLKETEGIRSPRKVNGFRSAEV